MSGYIGPSNRQLALEAAVKILGGNWPVDEVLKGARKIEAYLDGTDETPKGGTGVNFGGNLSQIANQTGNQASQGLPQ